jgi:phage gp29-like protein
MAIDKIESKPVEWFMFDDENRLRFRSKWDYMMGELLPDKKFLCPSYESTYNNPYGNPLLSSCFWPVTFKKGGLQFWVVFVEKYGMPHVIGKVPPGTKQEDRGRVMEMLDAMVQDAVAVINNDESIEFVSDAGKSASTNAFSQLISYCNDDIAKVILGQTLTTQVGNVGSYAAGKVHATIRQDIVDTDVRLVKQTFNQLIRWITEINWGKVNDYPTFDLWAEEDVDIVRSQRDKTLTEAGVKFTKKYWQNSYGLEPEDFELAPEPPPVTSTMPMQFAEGKEEGDQDVEDLFIRNASLHKIGEDLVKGMISFIKSCNNFKEAEEGILNQYKNIDQKLMQEALEQAMFYARIAGLTGNTEV